MNLVPRELWFMNRKIMENLGLNIKSSFHCFSLKCLLQVIIYISIVLCHLLGRRDINITQL